MDKCFSCICVSVWTVHRGQKRASVPWTGDNDVASWLISPRNQTQVLCKMSKYFNCWVISPALVSFRIKSFINFWHSNTYDNDHFLFAYCFSLWLLFLIWDVCSPGWHQTSDNHISVFCWWNYRCFTMPRHYSLHKKSIISLYSSLSPLSPFPLHPSIPLVFMATHSQCLLYISSLCPVTIVTPLDLTFYLSPWWLFLNFMALDIIYILMTLTCISLSQNIFLELQTDKSN